MKTHKRQKAGYDSERNLSWLAHFTPVGAPLDGLFEFNFRAIEKDCQLRLRNQPRTAIPLTQDSGLVPRPGEARH